jgi:hypothetical protein
MAATEPRKEKDLWDKLQIVFHPLNGLLTALTVALLGYYTSGLLRDSESRAANERVYTELMSSREQAESSLRKDMFLSIIQTFFKPDPAGFSDLEARMLNLELLTYNFHESLNLKPLFAHMDRVIGRSPEPDRATYNSRLRQMTREVATRQLVLLEQVGQKFSRTVDFDMLKKSGFLELGPETLVLGQKERTFALSVDGVNPETREISMEMGVRTTGDTQMQLRRFRLGAYDFPMIDNTRLSDDQRAAVVLTQSSPDSAEITLVYFPGSYASLKEKVSYDEVVEQLRGVGQKQQPEPSK